MVLRGKKSYVKKGVITLRLNKCTYIHEPFYYTKIISTGSSPQALPVHLRVPVRAVPQRHHDLPHQQALPAPGEVVRRPAGLPRRRAGVHHHRSTAHPGAADSDHRGAHRRGRGHHRRYYHGHYA